MGKVKKIKKIVKNSTFSRVITFCVEKFGRNRLFGGASHSPFYLLKTKSQIWEVSFREKFEQTVKKTKT